jgi:hypothetical protein
MIMKMMMITDDKDWVDGHKYGNNKYDTMLLTKMMQVVKTMINNNNNNEKQWQ